MALDIKDILCSSKCGHPILKLKLIKLMYSVCVCSRYIVLHSLMCFSSEAVVCEISPSIHWGGLMLLSWGVIEGVIRGL